MGVFWDRSREDTVSCGGINAENALTVLRLPQVETWDLLAISEPVRRHIKEDQITLCSIINAKSGYCSQSSRSQAPIEKYPLMEEEEIVTAARNVKPRGLTTSSRPIDDHLRIIKDLDLGIRPH